MKNKFRESQLVREAINTLCVFLAFRQLNALTREDLKCKYNMEKADVIMALGSNLPVIAQVASKAYNEGLGKYLVFCGGIGHSTDNLKEKISRITGIKVSSLPPTEAENYAIYAKRVFGIQDNQIVLENQSTNTSENIKFTLNILKKKQLEVHTIILIQDPLLQYRSYVTAKAEMPENMQLISYAPFIPHINEDGEYGNRLEDLWEQERFVQLILGEICRLQDDESGYGPKGTGYLPHVDIPKAVEDSYAILLKAFRELNERCL